MDAHNTEEIITRIAAMERDALIAMLRAMACSFPLDFSEEYLQMASTDRLRHIAIAASLHRIKAA